MVKHLSCWLVPAALCAAPLAAQTQASPQAGGRPDPLDARASVPALVYESSLTPARRASDTKPISWREANDGVARIGGWRAYAREAQEPAPAPAVPSSPPPTAPATSPPRMDKDMPRPMPMPPGHTGHKTP